MIPTRGEVPSVELPSSMRMRLLSELGDAGSLIIRMYEYGLPYQSQPSSRSRKKVAADVENLLSLVGDMYESTQEEIEYFFTTLLWQAYYELYALEDTRIHIHKYRDPVTQRVDAIAIRETPIYIGRTVLKSFFWVRKQL